MLFFLVLRAIYNGGELIMKRKTFKVITIITVFLIFVLVTVFAEQGYRLSDLSSMQVINKQAAQNNLVLEIRDSVSKADTTTEANLNIEADSSYEADSNYKADTNYESDIAQATELITDKNTTKYTETETHVVTTVTSEPFNETKQDTSESHQQVTSEHKAEETSIISGPIDGVALTDNQANAMAYQNSSKYSPYVNEVVELINQDRTAAGVPALSNDSTLTIVAMHRSVENAWIDWIQVSDGHHIRPNGQKASTICSYYNLSGSYGENLGRYQSSPQEIVLGWHNSAAHYTCMTNKKYTKVGIGVAQNTEGYLYWTAVFMD